MSRLELIAGNGKTLTPKCVVHIDNKIETFVDFIAIGYDMKEGDLTMMHNADTITLILAFEIIKDALVNSYKGLTKEHQDLVHEFLKKEETHE